MSEKRYEKKLREKTKKLGGWCLKFWCFSIAGLPDRIVLMPGGLLWFVELKSDGKLPSPVQLLVHRKLAALGFTVIIINSEETLTYFLNTLEYGL